ncbi:hypothetical protein ARMGADRAFT_480520 [Armillaria gallica]|uniref:Uncharacterized protein n=1 Tax=Armillaria gallica TaxID=47427 RepID=A0A2H3DH74_ARMGA|nr:hypothetical protein ARMGADRAFT_480520 [Armillaria gallica]
MSSGAMCMCASASSKIMPFFWACCTQNSSPCQFTGTIETTCIPSEREDDCTLAARGFVCFFYAGDSVSQNLYIVAIAIHSCASFFVAFYFL